MSVAKHQHFVGTGYFDDIAQVIAGGHSSTVALKESTETEQFAEIKTLSPNTSIGEDPACEPILGQCPLACGHDHHDQNFYIGPDA